MVLSNKSDLSLTYSLDLASNFHESFRRPEEHVQLHNEFAIYILSCGAHYKLNDLGLSTPNLFPTEVHSVTAFGSYYKKGQLISKDQQFLSTLHFVRDIPIIFLVKTARELLLPSSTLASLYSALNLRTSLIPECVTETMFVWMLLQCVVRKDKHHFFGME